MWNIFKDNNKETRTTSITSAVIFRCIKKLLYEIIKQWYVPTSKVIYNLRVRRSYMLSFSQGLCKIAWLKQLYDSNGIDDTLIVGNKAKRRISKWR